MSSTDLYGQTAKITALALWNDASDIPVFSWRLRDGHTAMEL